MTHAPSLVLELPAGRDVFCLACAAPWPCPDAHRPVYSDDLATLYHGDSREVLASLPSGSVDAVVTDPPYELGFMGKGWDASGIAYDVDLWREVLRVLKPGGHLLAFGGTRTWHRLACAVEDAGFEIRDSIAWLYGSGFPKSLDVSKAIDKAAGAERQVVGVGPYSDRGRPTDNAVYGTSTSSVAEVVTTPATVDAQRWQGWGTALKPAHEPIVVARKPLAGTVAANVLAHGTGALNIDGCRIEGVMDGTWGAKQLSSIGYGGSDVTEYRTAAHSSGRWPANVVLDEDQAAALDEQSGKTSYNPAGTFGTSKGDPSGLFSLARDGVAVFGYGDRGGASRFFYVAKAPSRERPRVDGVAHPTVKPLTLMRWLVRLVTPPDGVVLEPFAGSGTTLEAAVGEGFRVIGIEREADYLPLILQRLTKSTQQALPVEP